jgi:hypothetical protein
MRHISADRLAGIEPLLDRLRSLEGITEKSPGTFYRRSRAFLHFHEHGADVYADVRLDGQEFERVRATTAAEQRTLVSRVRAALQPAP